MAKANDTPHALLKPSLHRLIDRSVAIETESAQESGDLGFMARAMVLATLPHRKVDGNEFVRKNGAFTLSMQSPSRIGLPYGSIPRLLLAWVTTEAIRTKSRELELGFSLTSFMADLGLTATGGANGSITRLKDQIRRLFSSTIVATYQEAGRFADIGYRVADSSMLWWESKDLEQMEQWRSTVKLSEMFYDEIIYHPVPIDMRAVLALKQSSLALDIYHMLTHRVSYLKKPTIIPWEVVAGIFGSDYSRLRAFKAAFIAELKKVVLVYPQLQVEPTDHGLLIRPSRTHIPKKGKK